jgi:long-chain acyl-CoA synthetase
MNYVDFLFGVREEWCDNTVLIDADSGKRYTYRQLQAAVRSLSAFLRGQGYNPGDVIVTHLYNSAEAVIAHLAIQYTGCVSCLLDPLIPAQGLAYYLNDTGARCLITHLQPESLENAVPDHPPILQADDVARTSERGEAGSSPVSPHQYQADDLAAIFYTSGTTNRPKGVMLSPRNFISHFRIFTRACYQYAPVDRLLCFVPFSHGYGSKSIFLPCLSAGAAIVMMRSFQPVRVADIVRSEGITHLFGVPSHYQQLLRRNEFVESLRGLKAAFSAAALLKLETARAWKEKVGFCLDEGYGLIETCTGVAFRRGKLPDRLGNIGTYPADLVTIEIVADDLRPLPPEERGEIVVRGESVMQGYLNKPEETARALHNGWFKTGDMGYKTKDNEIILVGRIKDVINVAGIKVAPFEIEAVLNEHPDVNESAVLGVEDDMYGEVVKAFVQPRHATNQDERDLIRYLQKRLMNFQVPKSIAFVDEFPRNPMGKIDKNALRSLERSQRPTG